MGEVAEQVGRFVTAYSSDLRDESLDGQRVVVGGIVTGVRTVITKAKASMAIVTMEDLQGTDRGRRLPAAVRADDGRPGATARSCWSPAGSTTRARRSRCWPTSPSTGTRPRRPGRRPSPDRSRRASAAAVAGAVRAATATATGTADAATATATAGRSSPSDRGRPRPVAVGGRRRRPSAGRPVRLTAARRRAAAPGADRALPPIAPAEPVSTYPATAGRRPAVPTQDDEPPVPDEARARIVADATRRRAVDAGRTPSSTSGSPGGAPSDRVVGAMETFKARPARPAGRDPGRHPRAGAGRRRALPMELRRGVAYDAELLAEVRRRLGDGLVDLRLGLTGAAVSRPPVIRRICWTDESCSWYSARIALSVASSMSSSSAISLTTAVSSAEIVPFAAPIAKQARRTVEPLVVAGERLELAGDDVVLGPADGLAPGAWPSRSRGPPSPRRARSCAWSSRSMAAVSSSLMSRSAFAARARV